MSKKEVYVRSKRGHTVPIPMTPEDIELWKGRGFYQIDDKKSQAYKEVLEASESASPLKSAVLGGAEGVFGPLVEAVVPEATLEAARNEYPGTYGSSQLVAEGLTAYLSAPIKGAGAAAKGAPTLLRGAAKYTPTGVAARASTKAGELAVGTTRMLADKARKAIPEMSKAMTRANDLTSTFIPATKSLLVKAAEASYEGAVSNLTYGGITGFEKWLADRMKPEDQRATIGQLANKALLEATVGGVVSPLMKAAASFKHVDPTNPGYIRRSREEAAMDTYRLMGQEKKPVDLAEEVSMGKGGILNPVNWFSGRKTVPTVIRDDLGDVATTMPSVGRRRGERLAPSPESTYADIPEGSVVSPAEQAMHEVPTGDALPDVAMLGRRRGDVITGASPEPTYADIPEGSVVNPAEQAMYEAPAGLQTPDPRPMDYQAGDPTYADIPEGSVVNPAEQAMYEAPTVPQAPNPDPVAYQTGDPTYADIPEGSVVNPAEQAMYEVPATPQTPDPRPMDYHTSTATDEVLQEAAATRHSNPDAIDDGIVELVDNHSRTTGAGINKPDLDTDEIINGAINKAHNQVRMLLQGSHEIANSYNVIRRRNAKAMGLETSPRGELSDKEITALQAAFDREGRHINVAKVEQFRKLRQRIASKLELGSGDSRLREYPDPFFKTAKEAARKPTRWGIKDANEVMDYFKDPKNAKELRRFTALAHEVSGYELYTDDIVGLQSGADNFSNTIGEKLDPTFYAEDAWAKVNKRQAQTAAQKAAADMDELAVEALGVNGDTVHRAAKAKIAQGLADAVEDEANIFSGALHDPVKADAAHDVVASFDYLSKNIDQTNAEMFLPEIAKVVKKVRDIQPIEIEGLTGKIDTSWEPAVKAMRDIKPIEIEGLAGKIDTSWEPAVKTVRDIQPIEIGGLPSKIDTSWEQAVKKVRDIGPIEIEGLARKIDTSWEQVARDYVEMVKHADAEAGSVAVHALYMPTTLDVPLAQYRPFGKEGSNFWLDWAWKLSLRGTPGGTAKSASMGSNRGIIRDAIGTTLINAGRLADLADKVAMKGPRFALATGIDKASSFKASNREYESKIAEAEAFLSAVTTPPTKEPENPSESMKIDALAAKSKALRDLFPDAVKGVPKTPERIIELRSIFQRAVDPVMLGHDLYDTGMVNPDAVKAAKAYSPEEFERLKDKLRDLAPKLVSADDPKKAESQRRSLKVYFDIDMEHSPNPADNAKFYQQQGKQVPSNLNVPGTKEGQL